MKGKSTKLVEAVRNIGKIKQKQKWWLNAIIERNLCKTTINQLMCIRPTLLVLLNEVLYTIAASDLIMNEMVSQNDVITNY